MDIALLSPPTFRFSQLPKGGDSGESGGRCDSGTGIAGTVCVWGCVYICVCMCVVCYLHMYAPEKQATLWLLATLRLLIHPQLLLSLPGWL